MNLQEANRFRDRMRDLQTELVKLKERMDALEALIRMLQAPVRGRRKDESRKAIFDR